MNLLQSLVRAYERMAARKEVPSYGYRTRNIDYMIGLDVDGTVIGEPISLITTEGKRKLRLPLEVPQPLDERTSNPDAPNFLWDTTTWVIRVGDVKDEDDSGEKREKRKKRVAQNHAAFVGKHRKWLAGADDPGLVAFLRFLDRWDPPDGADHNAAAEFAAARFAELGWPEDMKGKFVVFTLGKEYLDGVYLHNRPAARELWERICADPRGETNAICLLTGEHAPVARTHPGIKGMGGNNGAKLVSFNQQSFESFGRDRQGLNAPVSKPAAYAYTTALGHLASDRRHSVRVGDTDIVFWAEADDQQAAEQAEDIFAALSVEGDNDLTNGYVRDALQKIREGRATAKDLSAPFEPVRFFLMGSEVVGDARIATRFYLEDSFGEIAERCLEHVERLRIAPPPEQTALPIWRLLIETVPTRKSKDVQPNLGSEWLRAILTGAPYPLTILSLLIERLHCDGEVNAVRVAMLKSILIRNFEKEIPVALDPECKDQGYLLGRLFALYEEAQRAALGDVGASVKDKFYASASKHPRRVFGLLQAGCANHLSQLNKQEEWRKERINRQIAEVMDVMQPGDNPFPVHLSDQSQAMFGLGYYHQRAEFFRSRKPTDTTQLEPAGNAA